MARLWYYKRDGRECGPVTAGDLKLLADAQRLLPMDQVRKDGSSRWAPARSVRGLFDDGERPSFAARLVAWWGPTGILATAAAVVIATVGVVILVIALRGSGAPIAPAPASTPPVAAATSPTPPSPAPVQPADADGKADEHHHRHLVGALREMREARTELKGEGRDHDDHLDETLRTLDRAIEQTERAVRAAGLDVDGVAAAPDAYKKYSDHPHIREALNEILEAKIEIKDAHDDFGGERDQTIRELGAVAEQLESALRFVK